MPRKSNSSASARARSPASAPVVSPRRRRSAPDAAPAVPPSAARFPAACSTRLSAPLSVLEVKPRFFGWNPALRTDGPSGRGPLSHQSRQAESGRHLAHLRVGNLLCLGQRLVRRRHHHVLQQLRVGRVQRLRVDLDGRNRPVASSPSPSPRRRRWWLPPCGPPAGLDCFHLLLHARSLLHEFANARHSSNVSVRCHFGPLLHYAMSGGMQVRFYNRDVSAVRPQVRTSTICPLKISKPSGSADHF